MDFTTTEWAIFLAIGAALFILGHLARKQDKQMQTLIAERYPDEWKRVNAEKMGIKGDAMRAELIDESFKSGYLKQQNDQELIGLHRRSKLYRNLSFASLVVVIILVVGYF